MKKDCGSFCLLLLLIIGGCYPAQQSRSGKTNKTLVWSDEFSRNGLPDTTKWGYDLGNGCPNICGWGNNELEYYTANRLENARIEGGLLVIEARRENMGTQGYTSSRMVTKNKGDWKSGYIEVRAKLPKGRGVWPAIWMLSTKWEYGGWPESGEIDIMEHVGYLPDSIFGTVHTKRFNHVQGTQKSGSIASKTVSADFHSYGIEWDSEKIDFMMDGKTFHTFRNRHEGPDAWPFDKDFHLILNLAVGGNWGGKLGVDESVFPQKMLVDYVRVYQ